MTHPPPLLGRPGPHRRHQQRHLRRHLHRTVTYRNRTLLVMTNIVIMKSLLKKKRLLNEESLLVKFWAFPTITTTTTLRSQKLSVIAVACSKSLKTHVKGSSNVTIWVATPWNWT